MAFTAADRVTVEQAIRELAQGKRVVRMSVAGKQWEFSQTDMVSLRELLNQINEEIAAETPSPSYILTRTSKGL